MYFYPHCILYVRELKYVPLALASYWAVNIKKFPSGLSLGNSFTSIA